MYPVEYPALNKRPIGIQLEKQNDTEQSQTPEQIRLLDLQLQLFGTGFQEKEDACRALALYSRLDVLNWISIPL